jgi:hypothetical protein
MAAVGLPHAALPCRAPDRGTIQQTKTGRPGCSSGPKSFTFGLLSGKTVGRPGSNDESISEPHIGGSLLRSHPQAVDPEYISGPNRCVLKHRGSQARY